MKDRIPTYPGRVKLVPVAGQANVYDMVRADEPVEAGTPLNKAALLTDQTATKLGLDLETATPDKALSQVLPLYPQLGEIMQTFGEVPDEHWMYLPSGATSYITNSNYELYKKIKYDKLSISNDTDLGATTLVSTQSCSMGYMNGYWYELADANYDNKLVFREDTEGAEWHLVTEADFTIPSDERARLYDTKDLIYFDGKYFIAGQGTIFESTNLLKWTISSSVFDKSTYSGKYCDHFQISSDGQTLYCCFTGGKIAWRNISGSWNITNVAIGPTEVHMLPDKSMLAFSGTKVFTSSSISDGNYTELCSLGTRVDYIEYVEDLQCYLIAKREDGDTVYYAIKEFTAETTSADVHEILYYFRYPERPNIYYNSIDKVVWALGNTVTDTSESDVYYIKADNFETLIANNVIQSESIPVKFMYMARVRPKNGYTIFRKSSSNGTAYFYTREFAKAVYVNLREPPTYLLAYDLREPVPEDKSVVIYSLQDEQGDDVYTELAKAIREGVNSI